jgi:hypothetical protein
VRTPTTLCDLEAWSSCTQEQLWAFTHENPQQVSAPSREKPKKNPLIIERKETRLENGAETLLLSEESDEEEEKQREEAQEEDQRDEEDEEERRREGADESAEEERDEDRLEQNEEERERKGTGLKVKKSKRKSP